MNIKCENFKFKNYDLYQPIILNFKNHSIVSTKNNILKILIEYVITMLYHW